MQTKKQKKDKKKENLIKVKKAILTELEKKNISKDWIKKHLIITSL